MAASAIRFASFFGALAIGAISYLAHLSGEPVTYWLGGWVVACALLAIAYPPDGDISETPLRRWLRRSCGVLAVAALGGYFYLAPRHGAELPAGLCAIATIALFLAARWTPFSKQSIAELLGGHTDATAPPISSHGVRLAVATSAVAAGIAVIPLNWTHHLEAFLLWLGSLALLVGATWERTPPASPSGAAAADVRSSRWARAGGPPLSPASQRMILLVILAVAIALRFIHLDQFPALVDPDEGRQGGFADFLWRDGFPNAFGVGWNTFPHLSFMVEELPVLLFGKSLANLRLSSAIVGTLAILPMFFWVRRWWGGVIGLLAAFILATNREALMWSRTGLNNIHQILVAGWMLATFARALQRNRPADWVWFGFAAGLGFHTYHACKLYPVLFAVVAAVFVAGIPGLLRRTTTGALAGGLAFLLMVGPQIATSYEKWDRVRAEGGNRFDVHKLEDAYRGGDVAGVRNYISSHVGGCLAILASRGPVSFVDPITAVPFLLGIGWMFWRWRDPRHLTCLVFLFGILGAGGMVTIYPPWKARLVGMLPVICAIPAVVIGRLRPLTHDLLGRRRGDALLAPLLVAAISATTFVNWNNEFVYWPERHKGRLMTAICKAIVGFPGPGVVYMVGGKDNPPAVALQQCFAADRPDLRIVDLPNDTAFAPLPPEHHGRAMILVPREHESLLGLVEEHFADASHEVIQGPYGESLHIFRLTPHQVGAHRGLAAVVEYDNAAPAILPNLGPPFVTPRGRPWQRTVWQGAINAPEPGTYEFRGGAEELRIDGSPVSPRQAITLAAGWHSIGLTTIPSSRNTAVTVDWRRDGGGWQSLASQVLAPGPANAGLLRRHYMRVLPDRAGRPLPRPPDYTRIDRGVSLERSRMWSDETDPILAAVPSTTEWVGAIEFESDRAREIKLIGTSPAQLYVDGRLVLELDPGQRESMTVWSGRGTFPLLLRSVRRKTDEPHGNYVLRLLWRRAGGRWTSVPAYRLPQALSQLSRIAAPIEQRRAAMVAPEAAGG